jgi:ABC-type multidrug transport system permease subunit
MAGAGSVADSFIRGLCGADVVTMENLPAPVQLKRLILKKARCGRRFRHLSKPVSPRRNRAATADPRAMVSRDSNKDYQQSLHVIGRFCTVLLFFVCWAAVRHWPDPIYSLSNMLKVAFAACLTFGLLRGERFADVNLNYWDEALAYIATAVFLDYIEAR